MKLSKLSTIFITLIFVIVFSFYSYRKIKYSVIDKTLYLKEILNQFSEGNIPQINKSQISDDEIGEIVLAVDKVGDNLNKMVTVLSEDITDSSQSSDIVVFNKYGCIAKSSTNRIWSVSAIIGESAGSLNVSVKILRISFDG